MSKEDIAIYNEVGKWITELASPPFSPEIILSAKEIGEFVDVLNYLDPPRRIRDRGHSPENGTGEARMMMTTEKQTAGTKDI